MVVEITPPAINNIGYKTYIIFSIFNLIFLPIVYFYFKETKGLSLEAVDLVYASPEAVEAHRAAVRQVEKTSDGEKSLSFGVETVEVASV